MEKIKNIIHKIKNNNELEKRIFAITLLTALFVLVLVINAPSVQGKYIFDKSGNVIGLKRQTLNKSEEFNLNLEINTNNKKIEKEIRINKSAISKEKKESNNEEIQEQEIEAEISGIITDIELSDKKRIDLPSQLSDGSKLSWSIKKQNYSSFLLVPITYLFLVFLIIKSSLDKTNEHDKNVQNAIIKGLPRFTNQLLLMLNAGMILSDAFEKIGTGYKLMGMDKVGVFEKEIISLSDKNIDHRTSTAVVISEFANKYNVKELVRISSILLENERRGSDVIENLSRESRYLWDERKISAREKGKLIDTKMTYPLGILLVILIVITMAPALLNM